jgi:hypothetical protein
LAQILKTLRDISKISPDILSGTVYVPVHIGTGLWSHKTRPINFTSVINNFGVKYTQTNNMHSLLHFLAALERSTYKVTMDWDGALSKSPWIGMVPFISASLWNGIANKALSTSPCLAMYKKLCTSSNIQHLCTSIPKTPPILGLNPALLATIPKNFPVPSDQSLLLSALEQSQQIVGTFLYIMSAIDNTMLMALNSLLANSKINHTVS